MWFLSYVPVGKSSGFQILALLTGMVVIPHKTLPKLAESLRIALFAVDEVHLFLSKVMIFNKITGDYVLREKFGMDTMNFSFIFATVLVFEPLKTTLSGMLFLSDNEVSSPGRYWRYGLHSLKGRQLSVEYLENECDVVQHVDDLNVSCGEFCGKLPPKGCTGLCCTKLLIWPMIQKKEQSFDTNRWRMDQQ
uniref:Uncharacterized protein n=1 Tax=Solanum lycopersicum TaxID=4081 RepID=A0A3Q7EPM9_SOLLC